MNFHFPKERKFWGYTTPAALTSGALIGYYSASPYWFVNQMGYSTDVFSYFLLPTVGLFVAGSFVLSSFVGKINMHRLFLVSSLFSTIPMKLNATNIWTVILYLGIAAKGGVVIYVLFVLLGDRIKQR